MNDGTPESENVREPLPQATAPPRPASAKRIPQDRLERFDEVANLLTEFGGKLLDAELTGFTLELWGRICRRRTTDCRRGQPNVWAASVVHVIARMNFLFDRSPTGWFCLWERQRRWGLCLLKPRFAEAGQLCDGRNVKLAERAWGLS
jgi:hypothetical protein